VLDAPFSLRRSDAVKLTLRLMFCILGCGIVVVAVGKFAVMVHLPWAESLTTSGPARISIANIGGTIIALREALRRTKSSARELLALSVPSPKVVALLLLTLAGFIAVSSELNNAIMWLVPPPKWVIELAKSTHDLAASPWAAPFALVIMAPLTEELFFRGLMLRRLLASVSPWAAIWTSALLFMAIHVIPWQLPSVLAAGLLLGWVYARTRSLVLCLVMHAFVNATVLLAPGLPFVVRGFNTPSTPGVVLFQPWWFDLGGVVMLVAGVRLFARATPALSPPPVRADAPPPAA
jgi:membrane protease YdiL (CAAX protease family)